MPSAINQSRSFACNCIGPQNGDPVCPCRMPAHIQREADTRDAERWRALTRSITSPAANQCGAEPAGDRFPSAAPAGSITNNNVSAHGEDE